MRSFAICVGPTSHYSPSLIARSEPIVGSVGPQSVECAVQLCSSLLETTLNLRKSVTHVALKYKTSIKKLYTEKFLRQRRSKSNSLTI